MKIWILICLISIDTNIQVVPYSMNVSMNDCVYIPNLKTEQRIYTFETEQELKDYFQWSIDTFFYSTMDKKGRSPMKEVVALYYGEKIEVAPIYEEKKVVEEKTTKTLKGYNFNP